MIAVMSEWLGLSSKQVPTTQQAAVVLYVTSWCSYCFDAKALLDRKGISYQEIDIDGHPAMRARMVVLSGGRTSVPQIFIAGVAIGGSDDLHALEAKRRLDRLLWL